MLKRFWTIFVPGLMIATTVFGQAVDSDNDGLPNDWEVAYTLSPGDPADALVDSDGDGVINLLEYAWGGDPCREDPGIRPTWSYNGTFSITFNRRLDPRFSIQPEQTDTLVNPSWSTNGFVLLGRQGLAPDLEQVTYQMPQGPETQQQFFRVAVRLDIQPGPVTSSCSDGPALQGTLEGDLGPAPQGEFLEVTCLEIRNDQPRERTELAWSGIPVPRELNLPNTDSLVVVGANNRRVAAQFNVSSRWAGPVDEAMRPIRWLQIAVPARVLPGGTNHYSLRRYGSPVPASDPMAASVRVAGNRLVVETGLATFTLDPANPALIERIEIDEEDPEGGRAPVYEYSAGAGPRLVFLNGGSEVALSTAVSGQVSVDESGFSIVESGPVRVVAELKGHFSDPGGRSRFTQGTLDYERFGFTLIASFQRASRDFFLEFHLRNEASDAQSDPWTDDAVTVRQASFELPFTLNAERSIYLAGQGAITRSAPGTVQVEQRKGGGTPWTRRARVMVNEAETETAVAFDNPFLALADSAYAAAMQMPWMRYREPQALVAENRSLSLRFISEDLVLGEAKGIWNFAKISLQPIRGRGAAEVLQALEGARAKGRLELERGLLVRAPLDWVNSSRVFASLGNNSSSAIKRMYTDTMNLLHEQTVRPGGQWDRAKTFGSQLWPDIQRDLFAIDNATPADNSGSMNYWNPSGAELLEFLRTGDPKWVWDFALPQSWLQMFTAYLNIGDHTHGNRNGLAVTSGGTGEGQWHRSGFGSDDYTYNVGMGLAYALRPGPAFRDRFGQAGGTVARRYDIPKANEAEREEFVNQVSITRQTIQHFEMLANAAEFLPGLTGSIAQAKLFEIVNELAADNLRAGVMAEGDAPALTRLSQPQQFMQTAMMYPFFYRFYRNYGDVGNGLIRRALTLGPLALYRFGMDKGPNGTSILVSGGWASRMECTLSAGGTEVASCTRGLDSDGLTEMYEFNKPHTLALLLMAHELDPTVGLCSIAKEAYDNPALAEVWDFNLSNEAGWWKGSAQMMQSMVFGVGLYDTCAP